MKANEAPKKIYVQLPSRNWIGRTWNETPIKEGDDPNWKNATNIEYALPDVFMKKAENFLEMLGYGFTITDNITHTNYDKEQLTDDFRKYME